MRRRSARLARMLRKFAIIWRRTKLGVVRAVVILAALAVALAASQTAGARTAGCHPGVKLVNGLTERTFCGPARATVHFRKKTISFRNGDCEGSSLFTINIGTTVLGVTSKPKPKYLGITVLSAPSDGTYKMAVVAISIGGKAIATRAATVTLKNGSRAGTFSGTTLLGPPITGSFSC